MHEPVCYGPDVDTAYGFTIGLGSTRNLLADLGPDDKQAALDRLRAALAAHETEDGVVFDSRSWIITAVRKEPECDVD